MSSSIYRKNVGDNIPELEIVLKKRYGSILNMMEDRASMQRQLRRLTRDKDVRYNTRIRY